MDKPLTWKEFYDLALQNYTKGGDNIVECWDEATFNDCVETCGPITHEIAMEMFRFNLEMWNEMQATIW